MMAIKFRGKFVYAISNGPLTGSLPWVYGDLKHINVHGKAVIDEREVLIGTVGQLTGVFDKNGVEIYEGDIIRSYDSTGEPLLHQIYYLDREARFATKLIGHDELNEGELTQRWVDEIGFEVVGNIFDNPELLKYGYKFNS